MVKFAWISFALLVASWLIGIYLICTKHKRRSVTPNKVLFVGTFVAAVVFFYPMYQRLFKALETGNDFFKVLLVSCQHSLRLFALDGDYSEWISKFAYYSSKSAKTLYSWMGAIFYLWAPMLTFGFILSFFKNLWSHFIYTVFCFRETHVFSELNEKSLALAKDILKNHKSSGNSASAIKPLVVFTDILDKKEEESIELIDEAKEHGAVLFRKDLESVRFKRKWSFRKLNFYLISEDEPEKLRHAESVIKHYHDFDGVNLNIFSDDVRTEVLLPLMTNPEDKINVTRINDIQMLVYNKLYMDGARFFENARETDGNEKVISAVIVGLGKYGRQMLKALAWYCQFSGYKLRINAFDTDPKAKQKFAAMCPELTEEGYNKTKTKGQPYYDIEIHSDTNVDTLEFEEKLKSITDATYIFVCLGNDETNLAASMRIREICERAKYIGNGKKPEVETVIYDSQIKRKAAYTISEGGEVGGIKTHSNLAYCINMIGDLESFYSQKTLLGTDFVDAGWQEHFSYCMLVAKRNFADKELSKQKEEHIKQNGEESWNKLVTEYIKNWEEFLKENALVKKWALVEPLEINAAKISFSYEYNYHSSITKAIHRALVDAKREEIEARLRIINGGKEVDMKAELGDVEHKRWTAYTRSLGYRYAPKRNDLAKEHDQLVPTEKLDEINRQKDL